MTLRIQIVVIALAVLAILVTFILIRKGKLGLKITLPWLIAFILVIIFAAIPKLMDKAADLIGIYDPVNMIFFLAIVFMSLIIYSLTFSVFENRQKIRDLIQKVAYLEEKLEQKPDDK